MKILKFTLFLFALIFGTNVVAQQTAPKSTTAANKKPKKDKKNDGTSLISLTGGIGIANYYGDLMKKNSLFKQSSFSFGLGLTYELLPNLNARVDFGFQKLQGADSKSGGAHKSRNLSFKSNVFDMSTALEFSFFNLNKYKFSPYVSGGIGVLFFNPYANDASGKKTYLRPLGTEGQGLGGGYPDFYNKAAYQFPMGFGVKYAVNNKLLIQLEYNFRITGTDYLDDVSNAGYVEKSVLDARNPITSTFTYRGNEVAGGEPYPKNLKLPRGNPNRRDAYYTTQLKVAYAIKMKPKSDKSDINLPAQETSKDRDGDGIIDIYDRCPDTPGLAYLQGCPDKDKDGIADMDDQCPDVAGFTRYQGCPVPDTDGDGIDDENDKCPDIAGIARYQGCPIPDTDGDGVNDDDDKCVTLKGTAANFGCPEISQEDINKVNMAAKKIFFKTYSAELLPSSYPSLNEVHKILVDNPSYKIQINGHTDHVGEVLMNQNLSSARAASVRDYLKEKGIDESRLFSTGYGELRPIADNNTEAGRSQNRRVEMILRNY